LPFLAEHVKRQSADCRAGRTFGAGLSPATSRLTCTRFCYGDALCIEQRGTSMKIRLTVNGKPITASLNDSA